LVDWNNDAAFLVALILEADRLGGCKAENVFAIENEE